MSPFGKKHCIPCKASAKPLVEDLLEKYLQELGGNWRVVNDHYLEKEFSFKNFAEALEFTTKVGALAEEEGHHPNIHLSYGKVRLLLWTHAINGLSENDFILAAKIDMLPVNANR